MQAIQPINRRPLHEEAVDRLRDLIVRGDLAPGAEPSTFVVVLETGPTVVRLGHGYEPAASWRRRRPPLA